MDAGLLGRRHEAVVAAHEVRARDPADLGLGQGDASGPTGFGVPLGEDGVERGLDLAVRAVAAEHTAVRGTRQHDVRAGVDVVLRELGKTCNGALDGPEKQACLLLGGRTGVGQRAGDRRCGEREGERRCERGFEDLHLVAHGFALFVADPLDERVDVAVAREVGRNEPERGARGSVRGVKLAREFLAGLGDARRRHDDGGAAFEQALDKCGGNRARRRAGDERDLAGEFALELRFRLLRDGLEIALAAVGRPPGGLGRNGGAGATEVARRGVYLAQCHAGELLTRDSPGVIEEDGLVRVEGRGHGLDPAGSELGLDGVDDRGVRSLEGLRLVHETQLREDLACGRGEHAVFAGDGIRVGVERGGIDHAASSGTAGGERNAHAVIRRDRVDGGVDEVVGSGLGGRRRRNGAQ